MTKTKGTALIVDDEQTIRYFLTLGLEDLGFTCETASNGVEALALLAAHSFDLMMLDIRMPVMDGLELLRRVRAEDLYIRVVMLTALSDPEIAAKALTALGADAFLPKPCSLDEIRETVAMACRREITSAWVPSEA